MKYTAQHIKKWDVSFEKNGQWIPCRPINFTMDSILDRFKCAFGVLTGRYDALDWEQGEGK